jgi:hypothetical protein
MELGPGRKTGGDYSGAAGVAVDHAAYVNVI